MKELILDGAGWNTADDVYDSFFKAVGAPSWHGRNTNALIDSIEHGQINEVEVPNRLVIQNYDSVGPGAKDTATYFVDLIHEMAERGCPVEIRTETGKGRGAKIGD